MYKEVEGDLVKLALNGAFDVVVHGCNAFCRQKRGLAPQMVVAFGTDTFPMEDEAHKGDINKLGQIDYRLFYTKDGLSVASGREVNYELEQKNYKRTYCVNAYTQYERSIETKPLDYNALALCLTKINRTFKGQHIGLPLIGCGCAGGDWTIVEPLIRRKLKDCTVTIVMQKFQ